MEDDNKTKDQDDGVYDLSDDGSEINGETSPNQEQGGGEVEDLKRQNLYLRADFDNYRKQTLKERSELIKFGSEPVIREMLGVLDNLERAATTPLTPETMATYKNGIEMIASQLKKGLEKF